MIRSSLVYIPCWISFYVSSINISKLFILFKSFSLHFSIASSLSLKLIKAPKISFIKIYFGSKKSFSPYGILNTSHKIFLTRLNYIIVLGVYLQTFSPVFWRIFYAKAVLSHSPNFKHVV